jgi:hypothetical protein
MRSGRGEYYQIGVTQSKLPSVPSPRLGFNGGYVEGGWVITGEPIPNSADRASWGRPRVDHPFSVGGGGIGAWEIAARYSTVNLNSNVTLAGHKASPAVFMADCNRLSVSRSAGIRMIGCASFCNSNIDINKLNSAGMVQIGQHIETLAGRAQVVW